MRVGAFYTKIWRYPSGGVSTKKHFMVIEIAEPEASSPSRSSSSSSSSSSTSSNVLSYVQVIISDVTKDAILPCVEEDMAQNVSDRCVDAVLKDKMLATGRLREAPVKEPQVRNWRSH